jgi:hypothetical protein
MKSGLKSYFLIGIAMISGLIVLAGYFIPFLAGIRDVLLEWSMIFVAVLLLVGVVNLVRAHWKKIQQDPANQGYSLVLVVCFSLTFLIAALFGPASSGSMWIFNNVIIPIESSLLGLLAIVLILACARMFNQRPSVFVLIFIGTVLLALIGSITLPGLDLVVFRDLRNWVSSVWAVGGMRGILLGVGLGTVAAGARILMGADRPYGG